MKLFLCQTDLCCFISNSLQPSSLQTFSFFLLGKYLKCKVKSVMDLLHGAAERMGRLFGCVILQKLLTNKRSVFPKLDPLWTGESLRHTVRKSQLLEVAAELCSHSCLPWH